jgi:hypothetical protein
MEPITHAGNVLFGYCKKCRKTEREAGILNNRNSEDHTKACLKSKCKHPLFYAVANDDQYQDPDFMKEVIIKLDLPHTNLALYNLFGRTMVGPNNPKIKAIKKKLGKMTNGNYYRYMGWFFAVINDRIVVLDKNATCECCKGEIPSVVDHEVN